MIIFLRHFFWSEMFVIVNGNPVPATKRILNNPMLLDKSFCYTFGLLTCVSLCIEDKNWIWQRNKIEDWSLAHGLGCLSNPDRLNNPKAPPRPELPPLLRRRRPVEAPVVQDQEVEIRPLRKKKKKIKVVLEEGPNVKKLSASRSVASIASKGLAEYEAAHARAARDSMTEGSAQDDDDHFDGGNDSKKRDKDGDGRKIVLKSSAEVHASSSSSGSSTRRVIDNPDGFSLGNYHTLKQRLQKAKASVESRKKQKDKNREQKDKYREPLKRRRSPSHSVSRKAVEEIQDSGSEGSPLPSYHPSECSKTINSDFCKYSS